jgi:hypothetical protein
VAEKLSALRTVEYFRRMASEGDVKRALKILSRAGAGNPPMAGDELPVPVKPARSRRPRV